MKVELSRQIF